MHIGKRLEALGNLVPQGSVVADIGTDHAYLPVWLLSQHKIKNAIAGDIAVGPCQAARNTVAIYNVADKVEVRQGSGLCVLQKGEADCITIAGMGGSTIIDILQTSLEIAKSAKTLILQPMAGSFTLRRWLVNNGWQIVDEELVDDEPHFYEIICAKRGVSSIYTNAEYMLGPIIIKKRHALLYKHLERQLDVCNKLLKSMGKSERAKLSPKYIEQQELQKDLEVLKHEIFGNC